METVHFDVVSPEKPAVGHEDGKDKLEVPHPFPVLQVLLPRLLQGYSSSLCVVVRS